MDGTLIDSSTPITHTINIVRSRYNLSPLDKDEVVLALSSPMENPSKFFYGTSTYLPEQKEVFVEHYEKLCTQDISLYSGIYELLESLDKKYNLAIATNADKRFAEIMLSSVGIHSFFGEIIGACGVSNPKPHPEMLDLILERYKTPKDSAILIGDSGYDEQAAKSAGISFLHVKWGFGSDLNLACSMNSAQDLSSAIRDLLGD